MRPHPLLQRPSAAGRRRSAVAALTGRAHRLIDSTDLVIHIDGGSRGNPGPAGFGVHAEDGSGRIVAEHYGFIGTATNNVAEYRALLHAFELARARAARRIEIRSDSELVVKQMNGVYKVKHPDMQELYRRASTLRRGFEHAAIRHVRREQNREADALANKAMDLKDSRLQD